MKIEINNKNWKKIAISEAIGIVSFIIASSLFIFVLEPWITEKPNIEIATFEPKFFDKGAEIPFKVTFENRGKKTASEILIYAIENPTDNGFQAEVAKDFNILLQPGKLTNATFQFLAPDDERQSWGITIWFTTTENYIKTFEIEYEYNSDSGIYQYIPNNS